MTQLVAITWPAARFPAARFSAVRFSAACFSTGGLLIKLIPWDPPTINGVRTLIAGIVIGLYLIITKHPLKFNRIVFVGALCMAGVTTFFTIANKLTTAGNAILLQYTAPVWIIILMAVLFGVRPGKVGEG